MNSFHREWTCWQFRMSWNEIWMKMASMIWSRFFWNIWLMKHFDSSIWQSLPFLADKTLFDLMDFLGDTELFIIP